MINTNRRALLLMGAATGLSACSAIPGFPPTLDPVALANDIKVACGIAVPAATVLAVINAAAGATAAMIISLVCSSFKNAQAQMLGGRLAAGAEVSFIVHVCDANGSCKSVPVVATVVKAQ